jgi:Fur family peroxide stress response transcriptional regulator
LTNLVCAVRIILVGDNQIIMNYSKQREKILQVLKQNAIHPTAEELLEFLKCEKSNVGMTTLYRNLNQLTNAGIIKRIDGLGISAHFDPYTNPHHHFICDKCGKIFDVPAKFIPNLLNTTQSITGFEISDYDIIFHGTCDNCKKGKEN